MKIKSIFIFLAAILCSFTAYSANGDLLNVLVEKGYISPEEADQIEAQSGIDERLELTGTFLQTLTIGGLIQTQYENYSTDVDDEDNPSAYHGLRMRRLQLSFAADLAENWEAFINLDFAGDGTDEIDTAYIATDLNPDTKAYFGFLKAPYVYAESFGGTKTISDLAAQNFFIGQLGWGSGRTGVQLRGTLGEEDLFGYQLAITNQKGNSSNNGSANDLAYWGRMYFTPEMENGSLILGADLGIIPNDAASELSGIDTSQGATTAANLQARDAVSYSLYGDYSDDLFSILVEVTGASLEDAAASGTSPNESNANPIAFTISPALKVTDKFEIVFGYSYIDSDGIGVAPGSVTGKAPAPTGTSKYWDKYDAFYVGGHYSIMGADDVLLSVGYTHARGEDVLSGDNGSAVAADDKDVTVNGVEARLQLLF